MKEGKRKNERNVGGKGGKREREEGDRRKGGPESQRGGSQLSWGKSIIERCLIKKEVETYVKSQLGEHCDTLKQLPESQPENGLLYLLS